MPLANILAPELLRKAQEIEDAIGPPTQARSTLAGGYLTAGYEKTPYDPKGLIDKPDSKSFNGDTSPGMRGLGMLQRSGDPGLQAFGRGMIDGGSGSLPSQKIKPLETAPAAPMRLVKKNEPTGTGKKGSPRKLVLPAGAVGTNERGESVTARGRKLGYLAQPELVTPYGGSQQLRTGERNRNDVSVSRHEGSDKFTGDALMQRFGEHLKEYEDNGGEFPRGYFDGMSKQRRADIIDAVRELQRRNKIASEGIGT